jgi:hypothetical protein
MRRTALLAFALSFAFQAHAAPASPDSIDALFKLTKADSLLDASYAAMEKILKQVIVQSDQGKPTTPAREHAQAVALQRTMEVVRTDMSWATLEPQMIQAYSQTFSQEEIDGMINFYATPIGQAVLSKTPALMQSVSAITQERMKTMLPKLQDIAKQREAEAMQGQ